MEQVQFDENLEANSLNRNFEPKLSILTRTVIKLGLAKDQKQANSVMIVISIFCLLLMSYFIISTLFPNLLKF
jgi:hypothetical protein